MLSAEHRLRGERNFQRLMTRGRAVYGSRLMLRYIANSLPASRFAFVVSQKVSKKAVVRNLLRRRMREIVRKHLPQLRTGFDVAISAKKAALDMSFTELTDDIAFLFHKARLTND